jgi:hypothetical protein
MHTTPEEKGRDNEFNNIIKRYFIPLENIAHVVQIARMPSRLWRAGNNFLDYIVILIFYFYFLKFQFL